MKAYFFSIFISCLKNSSCLSLSVFLERISLTLAFVVLDFLDFGLGIIVVFFIYTINVRTVFGKTKSFAQGGVNKS